MATQMQQASDGWTLRSMVATAVGLVGVVGLGAALLGRTPTPAVAVPAPSALIATPLGVELPAGANRANLPNGYADYIRPAPAEVSSTNPALGIELPAGANRTSLPSGMTDYLRPETMVAVTNAALGIELPTGANRANLPNGVTDYLRPGQQ